MRLLRRLRPRISFANVTSLLALFIALSGIAWAQSLPRNSVGEAQIKTDGVSRSEIKRNAVSRAELKDEAINGAEVANGSLGEGELANDAITFAKMADNSVGLAELQDGSVNGAKVVNGSLGGGDVADGSLSGGDVEDGSLSGGDVEDGSLSGGDVAGGTFLGGKITVQFERATAALADGAVGASYDVHCPEGQIAIGGGGRGDLTDSEYTVTHSSRPIISTTNSSPPVDNGTFTGWRLTVTNPVGNLPQDAGAPGPLDGAILPEVWVVCAATGP